MAHLARQQAWAWMHIVSNQGSLSHYEEGANSSTTTMNHRVLASEEHPLFWVFNSVVLLLVIGTTFYLVWRNGCKGLYGEEHTAPGLRASDVAFARTVLERQRMEDTRQSKDPPEVREEKLREWMGHSDYHMIVKESDVAMPVDEAAEGSLPGDIEAPSSQQETVMVPDELDGCDTGTLLIRDGSTTVPNCCAICLCPYDSGDQVVWSRNEKKEDVCPHAFHMDCMVEWLVRQDEDDSTPCPCCRRDFINKSVVLGEEEPTKRKPRWGTIAFDVNAITIR